MLDKSKVQSKLCQGNRSVLSFLGETQKNESLQVYVELALQICRYLSVAQQKEYKPKMADSRDLPEME